MTRFHNTVQKAQLIGLSYIFCSDAYLHNINVEYLNHDTLTDIITFPYLSPPEIEGDIFISVDRIRENAQTFQVTFEQELHRVIIHGVLHLCGQGDKTEEEDTQVEAGEGHDVIIKVQFVPSCESTTSS